MYPLGAVGSGSCTKTRAVPVCMGCVLHTEPRAPAADTRSSLERFDHERRGQEARTIVTSEPSLMDGLRRGSASLCRDVDCGTVGGSGIADGFDCGTIGGSDIADGTNIDVVGLADHLDFAEFGIHLDGESGVGASLNHAYLRGPCFGSGVGARLDVDDITRDFINTFCGIDDQGREEELKEEKPQQNMCLGSSSDALVN